MDKMTSKLENMDASQKLLSQHIIELVIELGCTEMYDGLWKDRSTHHDTYCEYDVNTDSLIFGYNTHGWVQMEANPSRIPVTGLEAFMNSVEDGFFWNEDLFSEVEVRHIERYYADDYHRFLASRKNLSSNGAEYEFSGRTLEERCYDAGLFYYEQNWKETLENIRENLTLEP